MKGAVLALFCAAALASAELNENGCPINPYVDILIPHPNCNKYFQCVHGNLVERKCASTTTFNVETQACDLAENVDCGDRIPVVPDSSEEADKDSNNSEDNGTGEGNNSNSDSGNEDGDSNNNGGGNGNPSEAADICAAEGSDGVLVAHENCNQFYKCSEGLPVALNCYGNLLFNPDTDQCDWPENVNCESKNTDSGNDSNEDNGNGDSGSGDNGNGDNGNGDNDNGNNGAGGNGNPSEAPEICATEGSDGVLVAHENCNQFYKCSEGLPVALNCYGNLLFNPKNDQCDWPENVNCENRNTDSGNDGNGDNGNGDSSNNESGNGDNDNGNHEAGGNGNPSEAPKICAAEGSDGVLVAHENCNQFYKCSEGLPVALNCYGNLLFNPKNDQCDWPENVKCENRNTDSGNDGNGDNGNGDSSNNESGNGDNDNGNHEAGGNGNPSEAPKICAAEGSDGVLVAHENCNQFYKCSEGLPVALNCYGNLLFNPKNDQCDWPENVNCENRNTDSGNDGNGDNGNGDSSNNESGNGDNDNGNHEAGGNGNPSEAPKICAAEGSDGVLVAHENCNQFYKCSEGLPVALNCYGNLLFNPKNDQCDWPENVKCENRNTDSGNDGNGDNGNGDSSNNESGNGDNDNGNHEAGGNGNPSEAPKICAAEGSDGVLVAHENCNQFYKCSEGLPVALNCYGNLLFNPKNDQCDWPENVNCENRNTDSGNDGNGDNGNGDSSNNESGNGDNDNGNHEAGGNGNPSEAPKICAAEGSDGVLVAHENCNQFYKCSEGLPVALNCYGNLLFNPKNDQCDWPENVNCENRNTDSGNDGNGDNGNGDSSNDDSGNGDNDNGNHEAGGNGNPSEAPKICATEGSDGVLVAHENCNQFYTCSEGLPVALNCYGNLLFNPNNDQCDWPENVNCENRNTDSGNDGNGDNGNGDISSNEDSGNGDNDNGNNGAGGNGDPSEASEICATEGSDGVLVAHENCNQFYKCSEGLPVALNCYGNLLFNPSNDQCDWPENVDCVNRNTLTSFNKHLRFRM